MRQPWLKGREEIPKLRALGSDEGRSERRREGRGIVSRLRGRLVDERLTRGVRGKADPNGRRRDRDGEIAAVYVENGQPVQFGDRLFAVKIA